MQSTTSFLPRHPGSNLPHAKRAPGELHVRSDRTASLWRRPVPTVCPCHAMWPWQRCYVSLAQVRAAAMWHVSPRVATPCMPAHVRASFPPGRRTGRVLRPSLVVASYMVLCRSLATLVPACRVMAATLHPARSHHAAPLPTTVPYTRTAPSLRSRCDAWLAAVLTPLGLRARV